MEEKSVLMQVERAGAAQCRSQKGSILYVYQGNSLDIECKVTTANDNNNYITCTVAIIQPCPIQCSIQTGMKLVR